MRIGLRELTFFLLLLGIVAGAGYFVFLPHWRETERLTQENDVKQTRLTHLDRIGQTSESLSKELTELGKALDFFESKLPNDQQIHSVLREITQITDKHKLTTKSVRTLKQTQAAEYVALPIEMEMSGSFEGTYQFLLDLERLPRITRVTDMNIEKDKAGEGHVQTKVVVSVYFEPNGKGEPPADPAGSRRDRPAPRKTGGAS
ncbi:MAG: type 4a pilus biogenesis protein PilO [Phycisphaerae bacterium]|nr:type 4a pilus biogenesis protein PilO [Phycisphaerae bacterium]